MQRNRLSAKHVSPLCECRIIQAPIQHIRAIQQDGKIPMLRVRSGATGDLELAAKAFQKGMRYVVVSTGSLDDIASSWYRTITLCQLMRIADRLGKLYVEEIHGPLYFWLEALCTPTRQSHTGNTISSSDDSIGQIYENAYAVLAIDDVFSTITWSSQPNEIESCLRLAKWTAQMHESSHSMRNRRLLLMASTGFVDLRTKLSASTINSILLGKSDATSS